MTAVLTLIGILLIIGLIDWVIMNYAPFDPPIKTIIRFVLIGAGIFFLVKFIMTLFHVSF